MYAETSNILDSNLNDDRLGLGRTAIRYQEQLPRASLPIVFGTKWNLS